MTEAQPLETIVVIDDDFAMRLSCDQILTKSGFRVCTYEDGARGLEGVAEHMPALVVVDLKMPGIGGMEVVARIHEIDPAVVIVVITGYATIGTAVDAMKAGAYDFLPKPFSPDELRLIVRRGIEWRRLLLTSRRCEVERELMKRRFVSLVSHQLKTPLVAVHQYLDVLRRLGDRPEAAAKRAEWIDRCLTRTNEMRTLVEDWLTVSTIEGGTLSRERVTVDVAEVLERVRQTHEPLASTHEVTLELTVTRPLPVRADPNGLAVLFDNLVTNAIKYNRPGGCVRMAGTVEGGEVVVTVTDTGIGIPEDALPHLFEEFYRRKRPNGVAVTGTGLGLPIAKRIAWESGGTIEVESTPDVGSTFRVRLPVHQDDDETGVEDATERSDSHR